MDHVIASASHSLKSLCSFASPRMTRTPAVPGGLAGPPASLLGGCARDFGRSDIAAEVVHAIGELSGLDGGCFQDQQGWFREFVQSFFSDHDSPAWIKIAPIRQTFARRVEASLDTPTQKTMRGQFRCRLRDIGREVLRLNERTLSTRGLRFYRPLVCPPREIRVDQIFVQRALRRPLIGRPLVATEEWIGPVHWADRAQRRAWQAGQNPLLEPFWDPDTAVLSAPLISMIRLSQDGRLAIHRVASLHPVTGEVIDLRITKYLLPYYFLSDLINLDLLNQLTETGQSEQL